MEKYRCYLLDFLQHIYFLKSLLKFDYENNKRKIIYQEHENPILGYVIGSKLFYEGDYVPPCEDTGWSYDDACPGELKNRKGFKFYTVATNFNITFYVPIHLAMPLKKD